MSRPASSSRRTLLALAAAAGAMSAAGVHAQAAWPNKPIRLIVNFPAGGAADTLARAIGQPLSEALGQSVVIENRGGANGNIGGEAVARSTPDGYTLLLSSGGMVSINPHLYPRMTFDPAKDLTPVASVARVAVYLMAKPALPINNVQEFIRYAKANPGKLTFGSPGNGSSPHLAAEMMKSQAGFFAVHVPYRGAAPALQDLLAGQIDFHFDPGIGLQHARNGRLKLLAVGGPKRSPMFPDVPTLAESGLPGFDADSVFGLYAPAGTPADVVAQVNREVNRILATRPIQERITAIGGDPLPLTPAQFGAKAQDDSQRFGAIIRDRKITGD